MGSGKVGIRSGGDFRGLLIRCNKLKAKLIQPKLMWYNDKNNEE